MKDLAVVGGGWWELIIIIIIIIVSSLSGHKGKSGKEIRSM